MAGSGSDRSGPGPGRPAGVPNKVTRENIERARKLGPLPHEAALYGMHYWLKVVGDEQRKGDRADHKIISQALDKVLEFATPAMPYYAPRLAAIAHAHHHRVDLSKLNDDELDFLESISAKAIADLGGDPGGTGSPPH